MLNIVILNVVMLSVVAPLKGWLVTLPTNIRLGWKGLAVINTLELIES